MPRYHFDTECGGSRYEDPDGVHLESIEHAKEQLLELLRDLTLYQDTVENKTVSAEARCQGDIVLHGFCSLSIS